MGTRIASVVLLGVATLVCGCGDKKRASVSGTVQLDGKPIEEGSIQFVPSDPNAGPTSGASIRDGKYEISADKGATIGSNKVVIHANRKTGKQVPNAAEPGKMRDAVEEAIPAEYNSKSTLTADIKPGHNSHDFTLKSGK